MSNKPRAPYRIFKVAYWSAGEYVLQDHGDIIGYMRAPLSISSEVLATFSGDDAHEKAIEWIQSRNDIKIIQE